MARNGGMSIAVADQLKRRKAPLLAWVEPRVRELYKQTRQSIPSLSASAVLIEVAGERVLVTAEHAWRDTAGDERLLLATDDELVEVGTPNHPSYRDQQHDILVFRLPPEASAWAVSWFSLERVPLPSLSVRTPFFAFGLPWRAGIVEANGERVGAEGQGYGGLEADGKTYARFGFDPDVHLLIDFNRKQSLHESGETRTVKMPHGMSGGAVVMAGTYLNPPIQPPTCGLHGILVDHRDERRGVLISVRIQIIERAIAALLGSGNDKQRAPDV